MRSTPEWLADLLEAEIEATEARAKVDLLRREMKAAAAVEDIIRTEARKPAIYRSPQDFGRPRKFRIGDEVQLSPSGLRIYPKHGGHRGIIISFPDYEAGKVSYGVRCSCKRLRWWSANKLRRAEDA